MPRDEASLHDIVRAARLIPELLVYIEPLLHFQARCFLLGTGAAGSGTDNLDRAGALSIRAFSSTAPEDKMLS